MTPARLAAFRNRAQTVMESLFPATIKIGEGPAGVLAAQELAAATGGLRRGDSLEAGILDTDEISFRVRKSLLPDMPTVGHRVIWVERELTFRLHRVADGGTSDPAWLLVCQGLHESR